MDYSLLNPAYRTVAELRRKAEKPLFVPGECSVTIIASTGTIFVNWADTNGTPHWNDGPHTFSQLLVLLRKINLPTEFKYYI